MGVTWQGVLSQEQTQACFTPRIVEGFDSKTTVNGNDNEMSSTEDEDITITNLRAT